MGRRNALLSDFVALSIVDDWITGMLVDELVPVMKVGIRKNIPFRLADYHWKDILARITEETNRTPLKKQQSEEDIQKLLEKAILRAALNITQADSRQRKTTLSPLAGGRRSNKIVSSSSLRRLLPPGFTEKQFWLLIKQIAMYAYCSLYCASFCVGATSRNEMIPGLLGTTVDIGRDDSKLLSALNPHMWDFSVLQSSKRDDQLQIFLGPARFVNHDCCPNVKFERTSPSQVGLRTLSEILPGQEIYASYGDSYFGPNNAECLCSTCALASRRSDL